MELIEFIAKHPMFWNVMDAKAKAAFVTQDSSSLKRPLNKVSKTKEVFGIPPADKSVGILPTIL